VKGVEKDCVLLRIHANRYCNPSEFLSQSIPGMSSATPTLLQDDSLGSPAGEWKATYSGHLPALDGLRGIAIISVIIYHYAFEMQHGHGLGGAIYELFHQGRHGVDLFFVLSGFLITGILLDSKGSPRYFSTFYARRTLRIFPLYYGVLFVVLVLLPLFVAPAPGAKEVMHDQGWLWCYGANVLMTLRNARALFNAEFFRLGHFWSLAVEEQFYLVWPLLVLALNRRVLIGICLACLPISLAVRLHFNAHGNTAGADFFTASRMDALAIGALIAILARGPGGLAALRTPARWIVLICLLLWMASLPSTGGKHWKSAAYFSYTPIELLCGGLICLALNAPPTTAMARFFSAKPLRFFGKYSYGLYVFHFLLYPVFMRAYAHIPLPARLHSGNVGLFGLGVFSTIGSVTVAFLSYQLYEKQLLKLKSRFRY
jgi:peptidoglycan/LPS O-acetylase OafA/YrhL